jgi:predicted CoA-binding protein
LFLSEFWKSDQPDRSISQFNVFRSKFISVASEIHMRRLFNDKGVFSNERKASECVRASGSDVIHEKCISKSFNATIVS